MPETSSLLALDDLPIAVALLDAHHTVIEANAALRVLLGATVDPIGVLISDALNAAGAELASEGLEKVFRLRRDGVVRSYRLTVPSEGPRRLAMLVDVTSTVTSAEAHQIAADVRARLLHDAEIGAWRYDPDLEMYYFPNELSLGHGGIGQPVPVAALQLLQHRDDRELDTAIRQRITREGGAAEAEIRYRAADGAWTHLRVLYRSGARLPSGRFEMFGISQSVTSLARARDEAKAAAQRLSLALNASRAGVFEYDFVTRTYWFSPEFVALVGEGAAARIAEDPRVIFHPDDRNQIGQLIDIPPDGLIAEPVDVRLLRGDGELWVRIYLEVEWDASGQLRRGVGLVVDIDESKRQAIALDEARRTAEEATAAKSDFLASVSHEIRTPLNGVVGVLNLLKAEPLSTDGRQLLDEAMGCTEMLSQLINDVLDFSKIEAGKLNLSPAPVDPATIVDGVARLLAPQVEAKGLGLATEIAPGLGWREVDGLRVRQCLFNIVGNAVKFTERGRVVVRLRASGEDRLRFEVEDTGIGVPDEARERLFGRFEQVETGPTRRFGGTGLGLAISRQLARLMGGELDYESREGEGSTFWFEIAAPPAEAVEPELGEPGDSAPLAGLSVLVVDDNRVNRLVAVRSVEALGATAEAVDSGAAAVAAVQDGAYDLVLMDVNMPGMDGLEATRRIRRLGGAAADVPILALTADVMRRQQQAYLAAGMNGMAPKPFSPAQLLAEIVRISATAEDEPDSSRRA